MKNLYMHLTNYSLNKNSEKFMAPEGICKIFIFIDEFYKNSNASKRLLSNIYK